MTSESWRTALNHPDRVMTAARTSGVCGGTDEQEAMSHGTAEHDAGAVRLDRVDRLRRHMLVIGGSLNMFWGLIAL